MTKKKTNAIISKDDIIGGYGISSATVFTVCVLFGSKAQLLRSKKCADRANMVDEMIAAVREAWDERHK